MPDLDEVVRMREASGSVETSDPLVALLYLLARDVAPVGKLEAAMDLVASLSSASGEPNRWLFTNGWLAAWAEDAAGRLRPGA